MTPSNPKADSSKSAATSAKPGVADELRAIDTSLLDQLLEMRNEEVRIEEYRQRADKMKDSVDPLVWQRVVNDYKSRLTALEARAKPLKTQARGEYAKLRVLLERITAEQKAAQVAKAELDFRHAVGELADDDLAARLEEPVGVLARCEEELAAVGALRDRFVEAFGTEIELDEQDDTPPRLPIPPALVAQAPVTPAPADVAVESPDVTTFVTAEVLQAELAGANVTQPVPVPPGTAAPDPGATVLHTAAAAPPPADSEEERTFVLPAAALLINPDSGSPKEYRLAAVNYLGRSDDNHLQIARPGVSRRHAVIMAANDGFTLQDLASQNGVFVNGERITEHALKDGEQIVIGDSTMLFRSPWPATAGRRSESRTRATKA